MNNLDPRIRTAMISVNPNSQNPAWHGAPTALGVLRGVSPRVAVWRPYPGANNIREIALHIAFYENSVANRLLGENSPIGFKQWKTGWAVRLDGISQEQWKSEIAVMKATHQRLADALADFDPALLDQPLGKNSTRNAVEYIHGVGEHSLYHTAQIEMIKSLVKHQGSP